MGGGEDLVVPLDALLAGIEALVRAPNDLRPHPGHTSTIPATSGSAHGSEPLVVKVLTNEWFAPLLLNSKSCNVGNCPRKLIDGKTRNVRSCPKKKTKLLKNLL